ncbi:MAG: hypothetical protein E7256_06655 [Lachnospiraceae bacterium]|nr:hypothetical protein [Lachnospiraceae bacterium]
MAKRKYYAVKIGRNPGVYDTWDLCEEQVKGFTGSKYKAFNTKEEAEAYISSESVDTNAEKTMPADNISYPEKENQISDVSVYIASATAKEIDVCSFSLLVITEINVENYTGTVHLEKNEKEHGVIVGLVEGVSYAFEYCLRNKFTSINIFSTNPGIKGLIEGAWKARTKHLKAYIEKYKSIEKTLKVKFTIDSNIKTNLYYKEAMNSAKVTLGKEKPASLVAHQNSVTVEGVEKGELESIFELLSEDYKTLTINIENKSDKIEYILEITYPIKEKLHITFYMMKDKILMQGKHGVLYDNFIEYISLLLEPEVMTTLKNTVYTVNIDLDVVEQQYIMYLPHAHDKLPAKVANYLHQAVYNLQLNLKETYDTTFLIEPAKRTLEAVIKIALSRYGVEMPRDASGEINFKCFVTESTNSYVLDPAYLPEGGSIEDVQYIYLGRAYTYFHNTRNPHTHWNDPLAAYDTTKVTPSIIEAHTIIKDILKLIDECYA